MTHGAFCTFCYTRDGWVSFVNTKLLLNDGGTNAAEALVECFH